MTTPDYLHKTKHTHSSWLVAAATFWTSLWGVFGNSEQFPPTAKRDRCLYILQSTQSAYRAKQQHAETCLSSELSENEQLHTWRSVYQSCSPWIKRCVKKRCISWNVVFLITSRKFCRVFVWGVPFQKCVNKGGAKAKRVEFVHHGQKVLNQLKERIVRT